MSEQSGDLRYAPPQGPVADVQENLRLSGHLATRWRRFWGAMIDGCITAAAFGLLAWLTPWNVWADAQGQSLWAPHVSNPALNLAVFIVLQGYLLVARGQTVGKVVLKTRIVRCDGTRASAVRVLGLRYGIIFLATVFPIVASVFPLVDGLLIFRKSRRCLHDLIADTTVVNV